MTDTSPAAAERTAAPEGTAVPDTTVAPLPAPTRKGAGLATLALVLIAVHWLGHSVASGLATVYWSTPALDWTDGAEGAFFSVLGGLGVVAFLLGLGYLGLSVAALVRTRSSGAGRTRAGGAVALSIAYLVVMIDSLGYALLGAANYGAPFLGLLGLHH